MALMLLRLPVVQDSLAHKAAQYLSAELGTTVEVGGLTVNAFFAPVLKQVKICDRQGRPMVKADLIAARLGKLEVKKRQIEIKSIAVLGGDVNLVVGKADSTLNLQFLIDYFSSTDTTASTSKPWQLKIENVLLNRSRFRYCDERYRVGGPGIDYYDLDLQEIHAEIKKIHFDADTIFADIRHLACREKSGLVLNQMHADAWACSTGVSLKGLDILSGYSHLDLNLRMSYSGWESFYDFINLVTIQAEMNPSKLDMRDIEFFAPDIQGMDEVFHFKGNAQGTVASFALKGFDLNYGNQTHILGDIRLNGLPDWEETFVHAKFDEFASSSADIESFTIPGKAGSNTFVLPGAVKKLGNIRIRGKFTGFYNDFVSNATFNTDAGTVITDVALTNNRSLKRLDYNGHIVAQGFDLGNVLAVDKLGKISVDAQVKGHDFSFDKADVEMNGALTDIAYDGNMIKQVQVDGAFRNKQFSGGIKTNDELGNIDFKGNVDLSEKLPRFDFKAGVTHIELSRLKLMKPSDMASIDADLDIAVTGSNPDNMLGTIRAKNVKFNFRKQSLALNNLYVESSLKPDGGKNLHLISDFAEADFDGKYTFADMADYLTVVFDQYLPSLGNNESGPARTDKGSFSYRIRLLNTRPLTTLFAPWLSLHTSTELTGAFDPVHNLVSISGTSPLIQTSSVSFRNWSLKGQSTGDRFGFTMQAGRLDVSSKPQADTTEPGVQNFVLGGAALSDSVHFRMAWNNPGGRLKNKADITGSLAFNAFPSLRLNLAPSDVTVNDSLWHLNQQGPLVYDTNRIHIAPIVFSHGNQSIALQGVLSDDPLDRIELNFKNYDLSNADVLTHPQDIDLDGALDGNLVLSDALHSPRVLANLKVQKLGFNGESLGDADIQSGWDNITRSIGLNARVAYQGNVGIHYPIQVSGKIFPENKHDNLDLVAEVQNLKIRTMEPFFTGLFSRIRGMASGKATITGDFSDPLVLGKLKLMRSEMLVDYLRTSYSFTGDLNFDKHALWFKNIEITDSTGNSGMVSGTIGHKAFSDWTVDVSLAADNLAVLNTPFSPSEIFYGKAHASGTMSIKGPIDNLLLKTRLTSEKATHIFIPISFARSIGDNDFIVYRQKDSLLNQSMNQEEPSVLNLDLGLDVTPDAELGIILPYHMGNIDVHGEGTVSMGIDTRGDYTMHGQYIMDRGNFVFNFENVFKRNFAIQKGGHITFNGSPYDADIDLKAVYRLKASLNSLPGLADKGDARVPVDCIVSLGNTLFNPTIRFSIDMPDVGDDVKRLVFSSIDTSNVMEMNQQMISLLVLNNFSAPGGMALGATGLGTSSYELLTNQLSSWLSQISKDFDIGVKYRPGDQLSSQELELALSTQLWDNRVTIDGNFGNSYNAGSQSSRWIGDVQIEVKITKDGRFRVRAFNRTNSTLDLITGQSPYTQGVGVVYRKEFDNPFVKKPRPEN